MDHPESVGPNKPVSTAPHNSEISQILIDNPTLLEDAALAEGLEHDLTFRQAFKKYYKAALWSMFLSTALIMEGYDMGSIGSFFGQPAFKQRFGEVIDGEKQISAPWQTGINNAALCGEIIGLAINGWAQERFGYKRTMLGALFLMGCAIFVPVFSKTLPLLCFGFVFEGIPWGIFQTLTTSYAAELCPQVLRPYLTSYVNLCWGLGFLLSSAVVRGTLSLPGDWSWRVPYILQWFWVIILPCGVMFAPEAPWWLVRKGRYEEAKQVTARLLPAGEWTNEIGEAQVAMMRYTTLLEKAEVQGVSWRDCFRGTNLRRTEIACMAYAIQWLSGDNMIAYAVLFFEKAGLALTDTFDLNIGLSCMYTLGTLISWFLIRTMGLRTMYMFGLVLMATCLLLMGILGFFADKSGVSWGIGVMMILLNLAYNVSIGPCNYAIVGIVPAGRVRAKTIVLARNTYNLSGLLWNSITPRMVADDAWAWGARGALLYLGTNFASLVWCYFRLPELKGRSFAELDILFSNKVSARKFKHTKVDEFGQDRDGDGDLDLKKDQKLQESEHVEKL